MYKWIKTETVPLTQDTALRFATMKAWTGERPIKPERTAMLRACLEDGEFYSPDWAFTWYHGEMIRVNGQHSSNMLVESGNLFPKSLSVSIKEFFCDTPHDVTLLFAQFDKSISNRSENEVLRATAAAVPMLAGIAPSNIREACAGIAFYKNNAGDNGRATASEKCEQVFNDPAFILWYSQFAGWKHCRRYPVIGAIYATYLVNEPKSLEFWSMVRDASHPSNANPTRTLNEFLITLRTRGAGKTTLWDSRAVYSKCIHAWNAYIHGRTTTLSYSPVSPLVAPNNPNTIRGPKPLVLVQT